MILLPIKNKWIPQKSPACAAGLQSSEDLRASAHKYFLTLMVVGYLKKPGLKSKWLCCRYAGSSSSLLPG
jgi:hypothetical protein